MSTASGCAAASIRRPIRSSPRGCSRRARRWPQRLVADGITNLVETYDPERYNTNATVAENLLFGTPIGPVFEFDALADNDYVLRSARQGRADRRSRRGRPRGRGDDDRDVRRPAARSRILRAVQLYQRRRSAGIRGDPRRVDGGGDRRCDQEQRQQAAVAAVQADRRAASPRRARRARCSSGCSRRATSFRADLPAEARGQIEFFDPERYNAAASLQDNILFGKIAYGEADATARVPQVLAEVLDALALRPAVIDVGLDYHVGTAGSRLSLGAAAARGDRRRGAEAARSVDPQRGDGGARRPGAGQGDRGLAAGDSPGAA